MKYTHSLASLVAIIALAACTTFSGEGEITSEEVDVAIWNVDIFDSRSKGILRQKNILIIGDEISSIVDDDRPVAAKLIIEGRGRLVVPGFIDTHVHLMQLLNDRSAAPAQLPVITPARRFELADQFLKHGTTTIMDMGQPESWLKETLKWQASPGPKSPNVFVAGSSLVSESQSEMPPHFVTINAENAETKIQGYIDSGVRRLKLYRKLEISDMQRVVELASASKRNMRIYSHTDNGVVTIPQALDLGVLHFEHFFTLVPSTLPFRKEMSALNSEYGLPGISNGDEYAATMVFFFDYINNRLEWSEKFDSLLERMASSGASISTTINVLASATGDASYYCTFEPAENQTEADLSYNEEQLQQLRKSFDVMMSLVKRAHDKGVKIRIGTDCDGDGRALISELLLLNQAGITTQDVLQIATWNGAHALGITHDYGAIEVGKKADLILFEKSPVDDIKHLLDGKTIIKSGNVYAVDE